jgi:hypothetical protein
MFKTEEYTMNRIRNLYNVYEYRYFYSFENNYELLVEKNVGEKTQEKIRFVSSVQY